MDSDRSSISRSGERPMTRWRRDQEPMERSQAFAERPVSGISRSFSRIERPSSRRGLKTDLTELGLSRPPTTGRNVLPGRPASPAILSRMPSARLHTVSSANLSPMSGLPRSFAQPNTMILDRPVTQHGLTGVRPGSARGVPMLARQIQDKKYYKQMLENKILELNEEIATISDQVEKQSRERPTTAYYDQRSKDNSVEVRELQELISNFKSTLNKLLPDADRNEIEEEAKLIQKSNDKMDSEIEQVFKKRQWLERKLKSLNKETDDNIMESERIEVQNEKIEVQRELEILQKDYEQLLKNQFIEKSRLEGRTDSSSIKTEALRLFGQIFEAEKRRDNLLKDQRRRSSSSGEESDSRRNSSGNLNVSVSEKQIIEIEKKIFDAKQELERLDTDADETFSRRPSKSESRSQHDREYSAASERSRISELEKLNQLEERILERLEKISNNMDNIESNALVTDELEMLRTLMDQKFGDRNEKKLDELKQESIKLDEISRKLEYLETKMRGETRIPFNNADIHNEIGGQKQRKLFIQKEEFFDREKIEDVDLDFIDPDYRELEANIKKHEIYRPISILEDKLAKFASGSQERQFQDLKESDPRTLKERLLSLIEEYNAALINEIKTVY
ncbi:hypothetical protein QAD02_005292 [Eretmocerus hayati]|uniref:Uncharacterized protein n=1 Tax=Eretmocerus hayati TaxID=131215 RepID=A0ACC2NS43_9HYME|nr:hypothetical protein QAD02_005292 [Eretmocerus hayati]